MASSNTYVSLPVPAADGVGAAVDTSELGIDKTFTISDDFSGILHIEISNDGGATFFPALSIDRVDRKVVRALVAQFMRVRRQGTDGFVGGSAEVRVGAPTTDCGRFVTPDLPGGPSVGAPSDISDFGSFNTIVTTGAVRNVIGVEVSEDGTNWLECVTVSKPGIITKTFTGKFVRLVRKPGDNSGVPPGAPTVISIGSLPVGSAGGIDTDELVKVTAGDAVAGYLFAKLLEGLGIDLTVVDTGGGVEAVRIDVDPEELQPDLIYAAPITVRGPTNAEGIEDTLVRSDHDHRLEYEVEDEGVLVSARPRMDFKGIGVGAVDDALNDKTVVTIPGTPSDGTVVMREDYSALAVQTSSGTFVDSLLSVTVPIDGDYWAIFEAENINQSAASHIEIAVAINGPAPAGVLVTSQREFNADAADKSWIGTTVSLGTLTAGDFVLAYFRKSAGGGPQTVSLLRRRLTIFKVQ